MVITKIVNKNGKYYAVYSSAVRNDLKLANLGFVFTGSVGYDGGEPTYFYQRLLSD